MTLSIPLIGLGAAIAANKTQASNERATEPSHKRLANSTTYAREHIGVIMLVVVVAIGFIGFLVAIMVYRRRQKRLANIGTV